MRLMVVCWLMALMLSGGGASNALSDPSGLGDPYFPQMGNSGYDVLHYDIALDVALAERTARAVVTIDLQALTQLDQFYLDFSGPSIVSLEVNQQASRYERRGGELVVWPPRPMAAGDRAQVRVAYELSLIHI